MLGFQFTEPAALLLLALAAPILLLARYSLSGMSVARARLATGLRLALFGCLVLAAAGLQLVRAAPGHGVLVLLDRSESIDAGEARRGEAFFRELSAALGPHDSAGLVVFGRDPAVELEISPKPELGRVEAVLEGGFTDIAAAMRLGLAALPTGATPRLVLLSDGNENLGDALSEARLAGAAGVAVDVVPLRRAATAEVTAERLTVPPEAAAGDSIAPRVTVRADAATTARVALLRENHRLAEQTVKLEPGKNVVAFPPLVLGEGGFHGFTAVVESERDADARNNRALGFTFVAGPHRVLYLEGDRGQERYLAGALRAAGLQVDVGGPDRLPIDLAGLAGYDCLILSDVSALDVSDSQMTLIRGAVRDLGLGLIMIGGDESFGVGGWYKTPVEEALPVDMDIRKQRFLPNVGVAIVIDRSGSMAAEERGVQKIQLAAEAAIAAVSLLTERDYVCVMPTDDQPSPVTGPAMAPLENKQHLIDRISMIRAGGGGIYCFNGLRKAAELVREAPVKLRHVILFADAADAEQQDGCDTIVRGLARDGITLTVVGLGTEADPDVAFLKEMARLGKGRYYLTNRASDLPRIFTREAILASRAQLIEQPFVPLLAQELPMLRGIETIAPLRGYIATTAKPSAEVGLLSDTKHKDPILATWQFGLGRAAAFTSDCKARWGTDWLGWSEYPRFWSQLVRWTGRRVRRGSFEAHVITRQYADAGEAERYRLRRGEARVIVDAVDTQGRFINGMPLHGTAIAPDGTSADLQLEQTAPGRYEATFRTEQVGLYMVNLGGGTGASAGSQTLGLAVAYPPEYADSGTRASLLTRVAEITGGREVARPAEVLTPRGRPARTPVDLTRWLLMVALALLPVDIAVRRLVVDPRRALGWLRRRRSRRMPRRATSRLVERRRGDPRPAPPPAPTPPPARPDLPAAEEHEPQRGADTVQPTPTAGSASLERIKRARELSRRLHRDDRRPEE